MNTEKAIKVEQDCLISKAVRATPEEFPQLCRIFSAMMKAKPCGKRLTLMVGECHSSGLAMWRTRRTGVILINRREIPAMSEDEMRCLLGHERGHFEIWSELDKRREPSELHKNMHPALSHLYSGVYEQIHADLAGVEQCRSAFVAGSHLSQGDSEMEALFNDPWHALPEKFYPDFELVIRIQALGILAKSEYYYELLGSELLGYGRWQITREEYWEKINHLFDPYMNFTEDDGRALGAFLGASMFIAGCRTGDASWHRELDLLGAFGDPGELLVYASIGEAYERINDIADSIRGISHPLKHIAMSFVEDSIYRDSVDYEDTEKLEHLIAKCLGVETITPTEEHDTSDENHASDDYDYSGNFVYDDEVVESDTHVA